MKPAAVIIVTALVLGMPHTTVFAAKSKKTTVKVFDSSGNKAGEISLSALDAPVDFVEKSVALEFEGIPQSGELKVVVDEKNRLKELYKENNCVVIQ